MFNYNKLDIVKRKVFIYRAGGSSIMSTNISREKRDGLIQKIQSIRKYLSEAIQDENTGNLLMYLNEIEKDIKGKKYGLVFEEHREAIDDLMDTHTPVLTEEKDLFIDNGGRMNFIIEGDNLPALKLLEKTHKAKIDLIYIDPPYNRGVDDFVYDDNKITKSDGYIHSKWLSFMRDRLEIAKQLLSSSGAIFLSIDDNEQANLKLLCDSIFGEQNFAGTFPWRKRTAKTDVPFGISQDYEWILLYAKSTRFNAFAQRNNDRKYYQTDDIPGRWWRCHDLTTQRTKEERPNSDFTIINPRNNNEYPVNPNRVWAVTKKTFHYYLRANRIIFPGDYDFLNIKKPQFRYFKDEDEAKALERTGSVTGVSSTTTDLPQKVGMTEDGTKDLGTLFERKVFQFPKPVSLIQHLVEIGTINKDNAVVLDFFAGSGTTGQAVLKFNSENENSNRKFILCTNNQNDICRDVTYERIKRAITQENYSASLKYYKIDFVPINERFYYEYADELLKHVRELVELENGINFTENAKIAIILTDEELKDFIKSIDAFKKCQTLYLGHNVVTEGEQEQLFKERKIQIKVIPNYYYREMEG